MPPEQQIQTSAGMETPTQTANRAKAMIGSVSANQLAQPAPVAPVTEPAEAPPVNRGVIDKSVQNTDEVIRATTQQSRDLDERRAELAAIAGEGSLQDMFTTQQDRFGIPQNLRDLQDIQLQLADRGTSSQLTQAQIAGKAGQTINEAGRAITQEQREGAIRDAGLAARAQVLQGNIETASTLVNQAVQLAYQDRTLRNTNLINQINDLRGVVDEQTQQILDKEQRKYEQDNFQIEQALSSVNTATASGFASQDDITAMTALAGDPKAQKEFADKIIAKGARTQYLNALAATRAAANAARANASNEIQGQAMAKAVTAQTALDVIDVIKNNPLGIKAIAGSNRFGRTSLSTALEGAKTGFAAGTAAGAIGGSVVPGLGTIAGGAIGGVTGFLGGAGVGTFQAGQQRADVAAGLGFLTNSETFAEMRRLKEGGVTFGSLTEGERVAIGKSADALFSAMEVDQNGAVTGVLTSEKEFNRLLNDFQEKQREYLTEANAVAAGLSEEDMQIINGL